MRVPLSFLVVLASAYSANASVLTYPHFMLLFDQVEQSLQKTAQSCAESAEKPKLAPVPEACENFWKYACDQQKKEAQTQVVDLQDELIQAFEKEMNEELKKAGYFTKLSSDLKKVEDPLLSVDPKVTLRNYNDLYFKKGKQAFHAHFKKYWSGNPLVPLLSFGPGTVLDDYARRLLERGKSRDVTHLLVELSRAYNDTNERRSIFKDDPQSITENLFDELYDKLPPNEFKELVERLIAVSYNDHLVPWEAKVQNNPEFRKKIERRVFPESVKNRLNSVYGDVKKNLLEVMQSRFPLTDDQKLKLESIALVWPSFDETNLKSVAAEENAHYENGKDVIMIYGGFTVLSDPKLRRVLSHEFGHAIDRHFKNQFHDNLRACFKKPTSMQADDSQLGEILADQYLAEHLVLSLERQQPVRTIAEKRRAAIDSVISCQPLEFFEQMHGANNPFAFLLRHPRWDRRANRILFAHPKVREWFGCEPDPNLEYCDGKESPK